MAPIANQPRIARARAAAGPGGRRWDQLRIVPVDPPGPPLIVELGPDPFKATTGDNGWSFIKRPKRSSFTHYEGVDGYVVTGSVVFDGFEDERSVEAEIEKLRALGRERVGVRREPPVVKVEGAFPLSWLHWVLQSMDPGDEIRRQSDGARTRAFFTLTFLQHLSADLVVSRPTPAAAVAQRPAPSPTAAAAAGAAPASGGRTYTVRGGDSLSAIAARELGSANRWHEIYDLNGLKSTTIQVGQVLKLPEGGSAPAAPAPAPAPRPAAPRGSTPANKVSPKKQGKDPNVLPIPVVVPGGGPRAF